jgi:hypothetical protein
LGRSGGTGRHAVFRAQWMYVRGGSNPPSGIFYLAKKMLTGQKYDYHDDNDANEYYKT